MKKYVAGLDSIRFLAAIWVFLSHGGTFPLFQEPDKNNLLVWLGNGIYNNLFSGPSAVIVFFVISGFVIHYPYYCAGKDFNLLEFYARRFVRIAGPLVVAVALAIQIDINYSLFESTVLWSLFAELIYYLLYPIFRIVRTHIGWQNFIGISFILSLCVIMTNPTAGNYPSYGASLNWLLGLPCWLLGCYLAETKWGNYPYNRHDLLLLLNKWRFYTLSLSVFFSFLRGFTPLGYPWTLNFFAIIVFFWLRMEILYFNFNSGTPNKYLEQLGGLSYSLYLTHLITQEILSSYGILEYGYKMNWAIEIGGVMGFTYFFYLTIESPSHSLSRFLAMKLLTSRKQSDFH